MEAKKEYLRNCEWCKNYRNLSREGERGRVRAFHHGCGVKGRYAELGEPFDYATNCDSYVFDCERARSRMELLGRSIKTMEDALRAFEAERETLMSLLRNEEEKNRPRGRILKMNTMEGWAE